MASKKTTPRKKRIIESELDTDVHDDTPSSFSPRVREILIAILLVVLAIIIILGAFGSAGPVGEFVYETALFYIFGYGVIFVPVILGIIALHLFQSTRLAWRWVDYTAGIVLLLSGLGTLHMISPDQNLGGLIGLGIGSTVLSLFDVYAGFMVLGALIIGSFMALFYEEINLSQFFKKLFSKSSDYDDDTTYALDDLDHLDDAETVTRADLENDTNEPVIPVVAKLHPAPITDDEDEDTALFSSTAAVSMTYEYPPTSLLSKSSGKPSVGDIKASANLIKRTLLNFGIDVEMDEVSIGPTVTRYALKPAEGVKLSRIVALKSDLALALAAHPIRIEAPIPGKSLVGIEIPNRTMSSVGLGTLLDEDTFKKNPKPLSVALGKGVTGKTYVSDLAKMPHLLIAGTTGSGKSVTVHNLILSLLYKNGPEDLRLILVDPKRVELTLYNDIPHLLTPVIKEPKKAILALKWAAKEMERRYDLLEKHKCRDIGSYHDNIQKPFYARHESGQEIPSDAPERMPYIAIFIDELADIMQAYPRELESGIVRLAQMSRAVGIHLILSTQRPSVNVITGLIKANIPSRLALQVASQIDSRTILDAPGAESLLGKGDMLYQGAEMSKPERMQCANVSEEQVKAVVSFIKKHNDGLPDTLSFGETIDDDRSISSSSIDDDDEDELYEDARAVVIEAGKASTSYIQRKLKVGYSRAARLIDLLEERGVVGPADGAKPREILEESPAHHYENEEE
jgi:S-DNA-T family DNA segregation ATPase FtsK/SpoIIIE